VVYFALKPIKTIKNHKNGWRRLGTVGDGGRWGDGRGTGTVGDGDGGGDGRDGDAARIGTFTVKKYDFSSFSSTDNDSLAKYGPLFF
jgi:hypothetical protein